MARGAVSTAKVAAVQANRTINGSSGPALLTATFQPACVGLGVREREVMADMALPPLPAVVVPLLHQIVARLDWWPATPLTHLTCCRATHLRSVFFRFLVIDRLRGLPTAAALSIQRRKSRKEQARNPSDRRSCRCGDQIGAPSAGWAPLCRNMLRCCCFGCSSDHNSSMARGGGGCGLVTIGPPRLSRNPKRTKTNASGRSPVCFRGVNGSRGPPGLLALSGIRRTTAI